jgi:hypothetical protein
VRFRPLLLRARLLEHQRPRRGHLAEHWRETKDSIRQCNALAGDPSKPDIVAFLGWEWTQVGVTPETHYGHKNVIKRHARTNEVLADEVYRHDLVRPPLRPRVRLRLRAAENHARP